MFKRFYFAGMVCYSSYVNYADAKKYMACYDKRRFKTINEAGEFGAKLNTTQDILLWPIALMNRFIRYIAISLAKENNGIKKIDV